MRNNNMIKIQEWYKGLEKGSDTNIYYPQEKNIPLKSLYNLLQATQHLFTNKSVTPKKILKTSEWHGILLIAVISEF